MEVQQKPQTPADPNSPEYLAQMAARGDGTETPPAAGQQDHTEQTEQRPAWLPEKFNSPEDLAKAYDELQKKLGQAPQEAQQGTDEATEKAQTETQQAAEKAVEQAGLDMSALESEVVENGTLSDKSFEALEKAGISREMVERYIEGQRALGEAVQSRLTAHVGGKEVLDGMLQWAATNLDRAEAEAFNQTVGGNEAQARIALDGLKAKYVAANGQPPANPVGGSRAAAGAPGYESLAQMQKDMSDPRYSTDPAFRQQVEAKLARSSVF
jgi:vacuolar-type H+-ATPase subunit H